MMAIFLALAYRISFKIVYPCGIELGISVSIVYLEVYCWDIIDTNIVTKFIGDLT